MKMKLFGFSLLSMLVLAIACNKDKYTTEPQLKFKNITPETVNRGDLITFTTGFTDDEGDIDSIFIVQKWYSGSTATMIDTIKNNTYEQTTAPPNTRIGDMTIIFEYLTQNTNYRTLTPSPSNRDTLATFGLVVKDKAGHRSNYAESGKILLKKP